MADNINITEGSGKTIAADDIGSVWYQRVKLTLGADGAADTDLDSGQQVMANSVPVAIASNQSAIEVVGDVADDAVAAGNPVAIGGLAKETDGTDPGSVAEGDRTELISDRNRRQLVNTAHPNLWSVTANYASAQTDTELKAAPGAGLSLYITDIVVSNGATAGSIKFEEDTAGTPVDKVELLYLAINGMAMIHLQTPIRVTANKNFGITSITVTTHSILVNGYTAP